MKLWLIGLSIALAACIAAIITLSVLFVQTQARAQEQAIPLMGLQEAVPPLQVTAAFGKDRLYHNNHHNDHNNPSSSAVDLRYTVFGDTDPVRALDTPMPRDELRWPEWQDPFLVGQHYPSRVVSTVTESGAFAPGGNSHSPQSPWNHTVSQRETHDALYNQDFGEKDKGFYQNQYLGSRWLGGIQGPDSRIMRRPRDEVGPYERAGTLHGGGDSSVHPLFVRNRGRDSTWYQYRTIKDRVPIDVGPTHSNWLSTGDTVRVPQLGSGVYTVTLYEEYT